MKPAQRGSFDLRITREFDAAPELVFEQWSNPEYVRCWFAPDGFAVTSCDFVPVTGGSWRISFASQAEVVTEHGDFLEVDPPKRLVFTLSQRGREGVTASETTIVVTFEATAGGTRMHFHQSGFDTTQRRDDHVLGWEECFNKLNESLASSAAR